MHLLDLFLDKQVIMKFTNNEELYGLLLQDKQHGYYYLKNERKSITHTPSYSLETYSYTDYFFMPQQVLYFTLK